MNQPTPAIVPQSAVRRLPRVALLLFCLAYVLPGFIGREPWKSNDMSSFGYMAELAFGAPESTQWFSPQLLGIPMEIDALVPYWLGAWAMQAAPAWFAPDFAARLPFILLLSLALAATWYGTYYLARSPQAQPVAFAFGGEALPADYARAMADGGLLALIACLGLAQLSHETTPALAQLGFTALTFYAVSAMPYRVVGPAIGLVAGLVGLSLSGAPAVATLLAGGSALVLAFDNKPFGETPQHRLRLSSMAWAWMVVGASVLAVWLAWRYDLWRWRIALPGSAGQSAAKDWRDLARLLLWFTWPAWPLALWTLWRWRRQLSSRHVALPLWFAAVAVGAAITSPASDRSLLLALPALAALAAFALPTLRRSVAALVDWFTLLFFTGCAVVIWVVWIAMQTGVPRQPAANVARLAPGFIPEFSWIAFGFALAATLAWAWLVKWRVGRHRAAIWRSLVLPAGGAALSWLLLMSLWLPLLDFARSYAPLARNVASILHEPECVEVYGLSRAQIAAFRYHGKLNLKTAAMRPQCPWLIVDADTRGTVSKSVDLRQWRLFTTVRRPSDDNENVMLYRRTRAGDRQK